jgi:hypothetical protein
MIEDEKMKRKVLKQLVCVLGIVFMTFPAWSAVPSNLLPDDGSLNQTPVTTDFEDDMILAKGGGGSGGGDQGGGSGGQGGGGGGGGNGNGGSGGDNGGGGGNGNGGGEGHQGSDNSSGDGDGDGPGDGSGDNCSGDGTCDGEQIRKTVRKNERTQNRNSESDPQGETIQTRNVMRGQYRNMNSSQ